MDYEPVSEIDPGSHLLELNLAKTVAKSHLKLKGTLPHTADALLNYPPLNNSPASLIEFEILTPYRVASAATTTADNSPHAIYNENSKRMLKDTPADVRVEIADSLADKADILRAIPSRQLDYVNTAIAKLINQMQADDQLRAGIPEPLMAAAAHLDQYQNANSETREFLACYRSLCEAREELINYTTLGRTTLKSSPHLPDYPPHL